MSGGSGGTTTTSSGASAERSSAPAAAAAAAALAPGTRKQQQQQQQHLGQRRPQPAYRGFVSGGLAAMAGAAVSHPLDVSKVLQQVTTSSGGGGARLTTVGALRLAYARDGVRRGLFKGLSASVARQAVYSSVRFGLYDVACAALAGREPQQQLSVAAKIGAGLFGGGVGALAATPLDVTLVRMQADTKLPPERRRGYRHVGDGLARIAREEGVRSMWAGAVPTTVRAMIITASQFVAYDVIKTAIVSRALMRDGTAAHLLSGFLAGFVASCTSTPVDVLKTRMMNAPKGTYAGTADCALQTLREPGGARNLYKGFVPTFLRQAPVRLPRSLARACVRAWPPRTHARSTSSSCSSRSSSSSASSGGSTRARTRGWWRRGSPPRFGEVCVPSLDREVTMPGSERRISRVRLCA